MRLRSPSSRLTADPAFAHRSEHGLANLELRFSLPPPFRSPTKRYACPRRRTSDSANGRLPVRGLPPLGFLPPSTVRDFFVAPSILQPGRGFEVHEVAKRARLGQTARLHGLFPLMLRPFEDFLLADSRAASRRPACPPAVTDRQHPEGLPFRHRHRRLSACRSSADSRRVARTPLKRHPRAFPPAMPLTPRGRATRPASPQTRVAPNPRVHTPSWCGRHRSPMTLAGPHADDNAVSVTSGSPARGSRSEPPRLPRTSASRRHRLFLRLQRALHPASRPLRLTPWLLPRSIPEGWRAGDLSRRGSLRVGLSRRWFSARPRHPLLRRGPNHRPSHRTPVASTARHRAAPTDFRAFLHRRVRSTDAR